MGDDGWLCNLGANSGMMRRACSLIGVHTYWHHAYANTKMLIRSLLLSVKWTIIGWKIVLCHRLLRCLLIHVTDTMFQGSCVILVLSVWSRLDGWSPFYTATLGTMETIDILFWVHCEWESCLIFIIKRDVFKLKKFTVKWWILWII